MTTNCNEHSNPTVAAAEFNSAYTWAPWDDTASVSVSSTDSASAETGTGEGRVLIGGQAPLFAHPEIEESLVRLGGQSPLF